MGSEKLNLRAKIKWIVFCCNSYFFCTFAKFFVYGEVCHIVLNKSRYYDL